MSRYDPLHDRLTRDADQQVVLTFDEIVGGLPTSAHNHRAWWANNHTGHSHAAAWLDAGRRVVDVNLTA